MSHDDHDCTKYITWTDREFETHDETEYQVETGHCEECDQKMVLIWELVDGPRPTNAFDRRGRLTPVQEYVDGWTATERENDDE